MLKRVKFIVLLAVLITICLGLANAAGPTVGGTYMLYDQGRVAVQLFAPDATKSSNQTILDSGTYTLTCSGWTIVRWSSTQELKRKIGANTAYFPSYGETIAVKGYTQIVFENASGSTATLSIEGM